jgi:hypothetical protein
VFITPAVVAVIVVVGDDIGSVEGCEVSISLCAAVGLSWLIALL